MGNGSVDQTSEDYTALKVCTYYPSLITYEYVCDGGM